MDPKSLEVFVEETNVNLYAWQIIPDGFFHSKRAKKYMPFTPKVQTAHIQNDYGKSAIDRTNWIAFGKALLKKLEHQEISLSQLLQDHQQLGQSIEEIATQILRANVSAVSDIEMIPWFQKMWEDYLELNGVGLIPVASDYHHGFLSTRCREILASRNRSDEERQQELNTLMSPDRETVAWYEQRDLLKLVLAFETIEALEKSSELAMHVQHYASLNYGYQGPELRNSDVLLRAKKLYERRRDELADDLKRHESHFQELQASQRQIENALQLTEQEHYLFEAARVFTYLKAYRVDIRHLFHLVSDMLFRELGKRHFLPISWFRYAERSEILALLSGKPVERESILRRREHLLMVFTEQGDTFIPPQEIDAFYRTYVYEEEVTNTDHVNGQSAFLGKVLGTVKILHDASEVLKVQHGDILVATTTNPDLLPAMYRASAFVTDSGGITSHAAIVAREMKKPCVIGTKFATKVFHDGDRVEVDADHGVVRKLSSLHHEE